MHDQTPAPVPVPETEEWILGCLQSLAKYVRDHWGPDALETLARDCGLRVRDIEEGRLWISTETTGRFCEAVFERLDRNEAAFRAAIGYKLNESYGAYRFVLWALSPGRVTRQAAVNMHLVSRVSKYEIMEEGPGFHRYRYYNTRNQKESRTLCLMRQANFQTMPTFWGLPPARMEEAACIARGDPYCEYIGHYVAGHSWTLPVAGALAGFLALWLAHQWWPAACPAALAGALGGLLLGLHLDRRRVYQAQLRFARESQEAIQKLADQESAARREISALRENQARWTRELERQLQDRTDSLQNMIAHLNQMQSVLASDMRGLGHDMRSPLTALRLMARLAAEGRLDWTDEDRVQVLAGAVDRMDRMLEQLINRMREDASMTRITLEPIPVLRLARRIEALLRALTLGAPLRVRVTVAPGAPDHITGDALVLDRITDNLLTNACRHTTAGGIEVDLRADNGYLVLQVADTGCGIAAERLRDIFLPGRGKDPGRSGPGHGLGLSVTVRLLHEVGGRLEVASREGHGTTFRLYIPTTMREHSPTEDREAPTPEHLADRVVTILPE